MSRAAGEHDGDGRRRVLDLLRQERRPMTVAELCERAGVAPGTARFHLQHLVDDGAVRVVRHRPAGRPGRPALHYRAVPAEAVEEAAAYRLLAALLADQLVRTGGTAAPVEAGRAWARTLTASSPVGSAEGPGADTAVVAAFFVDGGFEPAVVSPDLVELHRCPFIDLARNHQQAVCAVHAGLLEGLLQQIGSPARPRLAAVVDGSGPCLVHLERPPATG